MKEPIEELFKKSLENHELPFNEGAWASMNARLDAVKPTGGAGKGGNLLKYVAVATGITIISVATYLYVSNSTNMTQEHLSAENTLETSKANSPSTNAVTSSEKTNTEGTTPNKQTVSPSNDTRTSANQGASSGISEPTPTRSNSGTVNGELPNIEHKPFGSLGGIAAGDIDRKPVEFHPADKNGVVDPTLTPASEMIVPIITGKCVGEEFEVNNVNKRYIVILDASGNRMRVPSKAKRTFAIDQAGDYTYGFFVDCKFSEKGRFTVSGKPAVDIDVDLDTKYEAGLPTTKVQVTGSAESYTWKSAGQSFSGRKADFHYFKSGNHTIELTATNGSCSVKKEVTVYSEDYNLMAVNAFDPNVSDPRNNTFMPYALTQRKTNFRLIILDSRTGDMVYETTDADRPWDGTDRRTGKIDEAATIYIWKVVIENPEAGERGEYKGSVMKL